MQTTQAFTPPSPSVRARLAKLGAQLTLRPVSEALPDNWLGVAAGRAVLASSMMAAGKPAAEVSVIPVDMETTQHGRIKGEWAIPAGVAAVPGAIQRPQPDSAGVVFYIHGSGYNLCSTRTHRALVTQIAARTGLPVFATEYRLAPKHTFPAAHEDVERAYAWLRGLGWPADQVVVGGDSAGGHLTLDLALQLHRAGAELPAGLVMFSPLADPTLELAREREQMRPDAMASAETARVMVSRYLAGVDPAHPRLTHVVAPHETLPPTLIQAGGAEMLAADAHHVARMLRSSGTDVTLEVWPGQMHVFQAAHRAVPESFLALDRATAFIRRALVERAAASFTSSQEESA